MNQATQDGRPDDKHAKLFRLAQGKSITEFAAILDEWVQHELATMPMPLDLPQVLPPYGWALVPITATPAMREILGHSYAYTPTETWVKVLAAAPKP